MMRQAYRTLSANLSPSRSLTWDKSEACVAPQPDIGRPPESRRLIPQQRFVWLAASNRDLCLSSPAWPWLGQSRNTL